MRLPVLTIWATALSLTALALVPAAAQAVPPVRYAAHAVASTTVVAGNLPGRPGDFHTVRVEAGADGYPYMTLARERTPPAYVEIIDFDCPPSTNLTDFVSSDCAQLGSTSAAGTPLRPFHNDRPGTSVRVRATLAVESGGQGDLALNVRFALIRPGPLSVRQVASDSTYTWRHLFGGGNATITGSAAGIPLTGVHARTLSAYAYWSSVRGATPGAAAVQPTEDGWRLDNYLVDQTVDATFSQRGKLTGSPGNLHVGTWFVDRGEGYDTLDMANYRCPKPAAVDADDPVGSGCVALAGTWSDVSRDSVARVGRSLVLAHKGSRVTVTYAQAPSTTFSSSDDSGVLRVAGDCAIAGSYKWVGVGRIEFGSAKVSVHSCATTSRTQYVPAP